MCVLTNTGERICPQPREGVQGGIHFHISDPSTGHQDHLISLNDAQLHELLQQIKEIDRASHEAEWSWATPR